MLADLLKTYLDKAVKDLYSDVDVNVAVTIPPPDMGHFSTNVAFILAKKLSKKPDDIGNEIRDKIREYEIFNVNFLTLSPKNGHLNFYANQVGLADSLITMNSLWWRGASNFEIGGIELEFVSANPTGPLSVVNGRAAVLGDSLRRILRANYKKVRPQFYVNDNIESGQIQALKATFDYYGETDPTVIQEFPENGYKGEYIYGVWLHLVEKYGNNPKHDFILKDAIKLIVDKQNQDLIMLGNEEVDFIYESTVIKSMTLEQIFSFLGKELDNYTYMLDGAVWLKTSEYGDDKDRVIIRADGRPTYFHNDILYHGLKANTEHRLQRIINIWGADHHGYIARMNAVMRMWDLPDLEIILTQMVSLEVEENGESVTFIGSKREGQYLRLYEDFVAVVGKDAARWFFLMDTPTNHLTINVAKAAEKNTSNPVFYVQYANARLCSIIEKLTEAGYSTQNRFIDFKELTSGSAHSLILKIDAFRTVVRRAGETLSPHLVRMYLTELAQVTNKFYESEKILEQNHHKKLASMYLIETAKITFKRGLDLLGISAPEKLEWDN